MTFCDRRETSITNPCANAIQGQFHPAMKKSILLGIVGVALASPLTLTASMGSSEQGVRLFQCSSGGCGGGDKEKSKEKEKEKGECSEKPDEKPKA